MSEIADFIEKMYGYHYIRQTISNMTQVVDKQVEFFNRRKLSARYVCVYLEVTYIFVRRETVSKEAVYIAVSIREDCSKEVIAYTIALTEPAFNLKELLLETKERGLEEVLIFLSDGLADMIPTISNVFLEAQFRSSLMQVASNIAYKVRVGERAEICDDFKTVYRAGD